MARTEEREGERRKFSFIIYNIPEPIMGMNGNPGQNPT